MINKIKLQAVDQYRNLNVDGAHDDDDDDNDCPDDKR